MKKYNFSVFICRSQIFHNGHKHVIEQALVNSERVIVLVGSSHQPRSFRNPFSFNERKRMIMSSFDDRDDEIGERIHVLPLQDNPYEDYAWIADVQRTVSGIVNAYHSQKHKEPTVTLIGHSKDHTSYYLKLFPQWDSIEVGNVEGINSTELRETYFATGEVDADKVPEQVVRLLSNFYMSEDYLTIQDEVDFINRYRAAWSEAPYAPTFMTTDAVVVQSGHVLLVERRAKPGKGLMALPGGFVKQDETLEDSMLRELREETRLKVPEKVLRGSIKEKQIFDDPNRSARGRTITTAFLISLDADIELPKVRGGDDAAKAFWLPLADLKPEMMFEDHYFIIQRLIG